MSKIQFNDFANSDDGIARAEAIILSAGGVIIDGQIQLDCEDKDHTLIEAIDYLVDEWDYTLL